MRHYLLPLSEHIITAIVAGIHSTFHSIAMSRYSPKCLMNGSSFEKVQLWKGSDQLPSGPHGLVVRNSAVDVVHHYAAMEEIMTVNNIQTKQIDS